MGSRPSVFWLLVAGALTTGPGCIGFHSSRPVAILVRDAETQKPIPGAEVHLSYTTGSASHAPADTSATTHDDGIAHLQALSSEDAVLMLDVTAKGYLFEQKHLPQSTVAAQEPAHLFEATDKRPVSFVVEMFAKPDPTVDLVVPPGFRGRVKVEIVTKEGISFPAGQRCFTFAVPPSGSLQVTGPLLLGRVMAPDFSAHYEDSAPLSREAKDEEVGFWPLANEVGSYAFLVGTRREYESIVHANRKDDAGPRPSSSGSSGGGHGRRSRGGNAAPEVTTD